MPRSFLVGAAAAVVALAPAAEGLAGPAAAKSYRLTATLTVRQAVPKPKDAVGAHGRFTGTVVLSGTRGTLSWRLTFSHLSGRALSAQIHIGRPGKPGPIAIPLCAPCRSGAHGTFRGPVGGHNALLRAILSGATYANVHTRKNRAGEIRGQVHATPLARV